VWTGDQADCEPPTVCVVLASLLLVVDRVDWPDSRPPAGRHTALSSRHLQRMQTSAALGTRLLDGGFAVQQQRLHLACPVLLVLFVQEGQIAQMVDVAQRVLTGILPIGTPAIMHTHSLKALKNADSVQGLFAPLGMDGIMRQLLGRTDMHPVPLACDVEARFILMQHVCLAQCGFDLLLHRFQLLGTALHQPLQGSHAHRRSQQILHHFTGALIRQQLLLDQVDAYLPNGCSILHRRTNVVRENSKADLLTSRAALLVCLMFDHQHTLGWQIDHLAPFHGQARHLAQIVLTVLAVVNRVNDHQIGRRRQLQGVSCMTGLSPRLLAASLAQTLGLSVKAIRGGWQVTVVAIFGELSFQHADAFAQSSHLVSQGGMLLSELVHFFVFGHACTLLACSLLCKPLVLLVSYNYYSIP
jgi:hypothetical protein